MTALLVTLVGVLTLLVVGVAALALRLSRRVAELELRVAGSSRRAEWSSPDPSDSHSAHLDAPEAASEPTQYVITHLGDTGTEPEIEAAPTLPAGQFADVVLRETVIKSASLFHGVRRALSPENRNRIRFEMRREVKRSRKQRRADLREARREWEARQRAAMVSDAAGRAGSAA
jgi:hypothetical protein